MNQRIVAPFAKSQIKNLIEMQMDKEYITITCPNHKNERLFVTEEGLYCKHCNYTQEWAYDPFLYKKVFKITKKNLVNFLYFLKRKAKKSIQCVSCDKTINIDDTYIIRDEMVNKIRTIEPICRECWEPMRELMSDRKKERKEKLMRRHVLPKSITDEEE